MLVTGARDEENTHKTSEYDTTKDLDVENIDTNDNNTLRTIYEAIDEGDFVNVKIFPIAFINLCKKHSNEKNIPTYIRNNI